MRNSRGIRIAVTSMSVVVWITVTAMSFMNPSGTLEISHPGSVGTVLLWVVLPAFIAWSVNRTQTRSTIPAFAAHFLLTFLATLAVVLWAAQRYHRDFYTLLFQYILIFFVLALASLSGFKPIRKRSEVFRALELSARGVFYGFGFWVILMGYAIATRSEPRWIESIMYNFVTCIILALLAVVIAVLHQQSFRVLRCHHGELFLDDRNLGDVFTKRQIEMLQFFFSVPDRKCTCSDMFRRFGETPVPQETTEMDRNCRTCIDAGWSAINCRFYRNMKNQIMLLKKYLELLEIGTVINVAENFRDNKISGWKLHLFDDVRFRATGSYEPVAAL